MATTYKVDTSDKRLTSIDDRYDMAIKENDKTYDNLISGAEDKYQGMADNVRDYSQKQQELQQQKHNQDILELNQKQEQAQKDYIKEQSGAYVDWQKQSDQYGAKAEQMAAGGLANGGYSESSQVSMYNTYQNRVATARAAFEQTKMNFVNAINEAKIQNSSLLAEIAFEAEKQAQEYIIQGYLYKNQLIEAKATAKRQITSDWRTEYQNMMNTIMDEYQLNESARQADMENKRAMESIKIAQAELKIAQEKWAAEKKEKEAARIAAEKAAAVAKAAKDKANRQKLDTQEKKINKKTKNTSTGTVVSKKTTTGNAVKPKYDVDVSSVLALGFGPISPSTLDKYVQRGIVEEYVSGGKLKYRKSAATLKQGMLYSKLG